jgi:hypothetical protein
MEKIKIRVCVPYPHHGIIKAETKKALEALRASSGGLDVDIMEIRGGIIAHSRNAGVNGGKSNAVRQDGFDSDYYLSVDADIAFTTDHIWRLICHNKDIVGAAYVRRGDEHSIVAGACGVGENNFLPDTATGLQKVDWVGAGFTLINRHVFEATPFPWYQEKAIPYTDTDGVSRVWCVGEDIGFCLNAAEAGFEMYCDCDCRVEHLTSPQEDALRVRQDELRGELKKTEASIQEQTLLAHRQYGAILLLDELIDSEAHHNRLPAIPGNNVGG